MNKLSIMSASGALLLSACATQTPTPAALDPGRDAALVLSTSASGVQIYECRAKADAATGFDWVFIAPEAQLFDAGGALIGHHGAGPYWQLADGSRIVGKVKARADAPAAGAVPWLLLSASSDGADGALRKVTSVQRVGTAGGVAPKTGCDQRSVGKGARVGYSAVYHFFGIK